MTHDPETPATEMTDTPFGPPSDRRRLLRRALYIGVPLAAVVAVYFATRGSEESADMTEHNHPAVAGNDSSQPVMLSDDDARRIGLTYAIAPAGSMSREISTAGSGRREISPDGEVTYEEPQVTAPAPKIEGWGERLYAAFTRQPIRAGAPHLAIYSPMRVNAEEELLLAKRLERDLAGTS